MRELLVVALVLVCPLMMIWMMRGHGHGRGAGDHEHAHRNDHGPASTEELRRQRDELDRAIAEREQFEPGDFGGQYERDPGATRSG